MKDSQDIFESPQERLKYLRERTLTERFDALMALIKLNAMLSEVKIINKDKH